MTKYPVITKHFKIKKHFQFVSGAVKIPDDMPLYMVTALEKFNEHILEYQRLMVDVQNEVHAIAAIHYTICNQHIEHRNRCINYVSHYGQTIAQNTRENLLHSYTKHRNYQIARGKLLTSAKPCFLNKPSLENGLAGDPQKKRNIEAAQQRKAGLEKQKSVESVGHQGAHSRNQGTVQERERSQRSSKENSQGTVRESEKRTHHEKGNLRNAGDRVADSGHRRPVQREINQGGPMQESLPPHTEVNPTLPALPEKSPGEQPNSERCHKQILIEKQKSVERAEYQEAASRNQGAVPQREIGQKHSEEKNEEVVKQSEKRAHHEKVNLRNYARYQVADSGHRRPVQRREINQGAPVQKSLPAHTEANPTLPALPERRPGGQSNSERCPKQILIKKQKSVERAEYQEAASRYQGAVLQREISPKGSKEKNQEVVKQSEKRNTGDQVADSGHRRPVQRREINQGAPVQKSLPAHTEANLMLPALPERRPGGQSNSERCHKQILIEKQKSVERAEYQEVASRYQGTVLQRDISPKGSKENNQEVVKQSEKRAHCEKVNLRNTGDHVVDSGHQRPVQRREINQGAPVQKSLPAHTEAKSTLPDSPEKSAGEQPNSEIHPKQIQNEINQQKNTTNRKR